MSLYDLLCREVADVLTDYLEGALPVERRVPLEQHLLMCQGCTAYLDQLRTTVALTGRISEEDVPEPVMDRLVGLLGGEDR